MDTLLCRPLDQAHDRAEFRCENEQLTDYIRTKARKERDLGLSAVFVVSYSMNPNKIVGYYTLSSLSVDIALLDAAVRPKFPRYPEVPATLLGRLARHQEHKGEGIGEYLLIAALRMAFDARQRVGSYAVVTDPIDDKAAAFYRRFGFIAAEGNARRLHLPMETIGRLGALG